MHSFCLFHTQVSSLHVRPNAITYIIINLYTQSVNVFLVFWLIPILISSVPSIALSSRRLYLLFSVSVCVSLPISFAFDRFYIELVASPILRGVNSLSDASVNSYKILNKSKFDRPDVLITKLLTSKVLAE